MGSCIYSYLLYIQADLSPRQATVHKRFSFFMHDLLSDLVIVSSTGLMRRFSKVVGFILSKSGYNMPFLWHGLYLVCNSS